MTDAYNLWVSHVAPLDNEKFPPAVSLESLCRDLSGGVALVVSKCRLDTSDLLFFNLLPLFSLLLSKIKMATQNFRVFLLFIEISTLLVSNNVKE